MHINFLHMCVYLKRDGWAKHQGTVVVLAISNRGPEKEVCCQVWTGEAAHQWICEYLVSCSVFLPATGVEILILLTKFHVVLLLYVAGLYCSIVWEENEHFSIISLPLVNYYNCSSVIKTPRTFPRPTRTPWHMMKWRQYVRMSRPVVWKWTMNLCGRRGTRSTAGTSSAVPSPRPTTAARPFTRTTRALRESLG